MSNPVDVKWFTSAMPGAPTLSGEAGKLIDVMDACLVNGFGSVTLTSLTVSGGVATATKTGHGFIDHVVLLIDGATPSSLNGDKRIALIDANTFTFDAAEISDQTATGTITAKMAPAYWSKPYSGTNKAAYARTDISATAMLLRVDDSATQYPSLTMYESMSDVDNGSGASSVMYALKSNAASSAARGWRFFADQAMLYFIIDSSNDTAWRSAWAFGDLISYKSGDAYHCVLIANPVANAANYFNYLGTGTSSGLKIARLHDQISQNVSASKLSFMTSYLGYGGLTGSTNPVDNSMHAWPILVGTASYIRGILAGTLNPIHNGNLGDYQFFDKLGKKYLSSKINSTYEALFDLTGPWR